MSEILPNIETEKLTNRLKHAAGKIAMRTAAVLAGAGALFTGVVVAESATGQEARAEAGPNDMYNEFSTRANAAERSWCAPPSRWNLCYNVMKVIGDEATEPAQYVVRSKGWSEEELHNGRADAFRHCFFMAKATREHGVWIAKEFGDRHEDGVPDGFPPQDPAEKRMDLQNNIEGRRIGVTEGSIFNRCVDAAQNGQLVTIS